MNFKDELNQITKTPQQVLDEKWIKESEEIINIAESDYNCIKNKLLEKAKNGGYVIIFNKKRITIRHETNYLSKSIKRINKTVTKPKILGTGKNVYGNILYDIKSPKAYDLYLKTINRMAYIDDIKVEPIFIESSTDKNGQVNLPYRYTGIYTVLHKITAYLECYIEY